MQNKIIEVVDCDIFKQELELAKVAIPFAEQFLTNKKNVAKLFGVHVNTITNWIKDGIFKENIHYFKDNGKIIFDPMELLKYKANPVKKEAKEELYRLSKEIKSLV